MNFVELRYGEVRGDGSSTHSPGSEESLMYTPR
jgi:hypothetical protein